METKTNASTCRTTRCRQKPPKEHSLEHFCHWNGHYTSGHDNGYGVEAAIYALARDQEVPFSPRLPKLSGKSL